MRLQGYYLIIGAPDRALQGGEAATPRLLCKEIVEEWKRTVVFVSPQGSTGEHLPNQSESRLYTSGKIDVFFVFFKYLETVFGHRNEFNT